MRWGLGPVFAYEWLTTSRRWQIYATRSLFVAALLVSLGVVWLSEAGGRPTPTFRGQGWIGQSFYFAFVGTQLALVLLAAPAATAGAICLDKARGTLAHLLVTDLSDAEIVLGKLAARLVPVVGLVACALPVMAIGTLLGGVDPVALSGAFLVTLGVAVLGCAVALVLSVWAGKAHEVLLATYAAWMLWLLVLPMWRMLAGTFGWAIFPPAWMTRADPFWLAFAPYVRPTSVTSGDFFNFFLGALVISAALTAVAVMTVRAAARRADRPRRRWRWRIPDLIGQWTRHLPGPSLDGNPVLWREWHRRAPSRWGRAVWLLYIIVAGGVSLIVIVGNLRTGGTPQGLAAVINGFQVSGGLLLLSVASATSLAEERTRGSLDVLLTTPLPTRAIVWGKWLGAFRTAPWLAVFPTLVAISCTLYGRGFWLGPTIVCGLVLAYGAAITSLGLALATWIPRLGRAVAASVGIYALVTVGWLFLVMTLIRGPADDAIAQASPFFGPGQMTYLCGDLTSRGWGVCTAWAIFWIIAYGLGAIVLLVATLFTFDRSLGRISDAPLLQRPTPGRGRKKIVCLEEDLV